MSVTNGIAKLELLNSFLMDPTWPHKFNNFFYMQNAIFLIINKWSQYLTS